MSLVLSGGLDEQYIQKNWKTNSVVYKANTSQLIQMQQQQKQIVNPPYVHSLDITKKDQNSLSMYLNVNYLYYWNSWIGKWKYYIF